MEKSPDAFRTISEVAEELDLPQHVLRFWETKFPQIRPLKRGGGRRYYRPDDVELLRGIRHLLYGEGYTIRGVQRILKEDGPRYVQAILRDAMDAVEDEAGYDEDYGSAPADRRAVPSVEDDAPPPSGKSTLSGFFGLLPGRNRAAPVEEPEEPVVEPARARKPSRRRASEDEPSFPELPLLPDFDPPPVEPPSRRRVDEPLPNFPFRGLGREPSEADDFRPGEAARHEPSRHEPPFHEPSRQETSRHEPLMHEPRRVVEEEPPRRVSPYAAPRDEPAPSRLTAFRPIEEPVPGGLSPDEVRQLKAVLFELQECWRILDEARRGGR